MRRAARQVAYLSSGRVAAGGRPIGESRRVWARGLCTKRNVRNMQTNSERKVAVYVSKAEKQRDSQVLLNRMTTAARAIGNRFSQLISLQREKPREKSKKTFFCQIDEEITGQPCWWLNVVVQWLRRWSLFSIQYPMYDPIKIKRCQQNLTKEKRVNLIDFGWS